MHTQASRHFLVRAPLVASIILGLAACGGGGSTRPNITPPPAPAPSPSPAPSPAPTPAPPPAPPAYDMPDDNILVPTHIQEAHDAGFTGKGATVAIFDSGLDSSLETFKDLNLSYFTASSGDPLVKTDAPVGDTGSHGSLMTAILAGGETNAYAGGVAPDAHVMVARICYDNSCTVQKADVQTLFDAGARIFNYSLGSDISVSELTQENPMNIGSFGAYAFGDAVEKGALFVFSAGNSGQDKVNKYGVAPLYATKLQKGWIMAVNVAISSEGEVTGLYVDSTNQEDPGSARCGVAAQWCLAAPGYTHTPGVEGTPFEEGYSAGTSNSAAIISGTAALVSGAFPWMDGHNIQQTVLTTADHLSDTEVDEHGNPVRDYEAGTTYTPNETYGWGIVNAWRAVHGPGQFNGEFSADTKGYTSTFENAIAGSGSLRVTGVDDGRLTLAGANTYTGGTTVEGATLRLTGSLMSDVTVNGGRFEGAGHVHANVNNTGTGTVATINDFANKSLTITGNYTAGANATTSIALGHTFMVGGTAKLDGTLTLTAPSESYSPKSSELVIYAAEILGPFATVDDSTLPLYSAEIGYTGNTVEATLTRKDVGQAVAMSASSPVLVSAASGVEAALKQADTWSQTDYAGHAQFLDNAAKFLSAESMAMAQASVASLSGQAHGTMGAVEMATSHQVDHAVSLHQNAGWPGDRVSAWVQGFSTDFGLSQTGFASASARGHGELVGLDIPITPRLHGGILVGQAQTDSQLDALAGEVEERDSFGGIYASYRYNTAGYVAGRLTWTSAELTLKRNVLLGNTLQTVGTERKDKIGRVSLETGYRLGAFTPYLSWNVLRWNRGAFTETGAGGFGLTAPEGSHLVRYANLGLRWDTAFHWAGGSSTLTGYAAWKRVMSGASLDFTASLVGSQGTPFVVAGQNLVRNTGEAGLTFRTRINQDWDWFVDANYRGAANRFHAISANAGLSFTF